MANLDTIGASPEIPMEFKEILTADCSTPHEIDDGIAVTPLDTNREAYQVDVVVADTSKLYGDYSLFRQALLHGESIYGDPEDNSTYEPMLPEEHVQNRSLVADRRRSALIISMVVGEEFEGVECFETRFDEVRVNANLNYKNFGDVIAMYPDYQRFSRAAAYILKALHQPDARTDRLQSQLLQQRSFTRGSRINETFMIAGNYLVGKDREVNQKPAIYRVHNRGDGTTDMDDLMGSLAFFSRYPQPHDGLELELYCRVTSPLRRLEDFVMNGLLRASHEGRELSASDDQRIAQTIKRKNQLIVMRAASGMQRPEPVETWEATPQS